MSERRTLLILALIGFCIRFLLAYGFEGTGDTGSWMLGAKTGIEKKDFGYGVNPYDGTCLPDCELLNWPPLTFHYMTLMGLMERNINFFGLPEWGFYKLLPIVADTGIAMLLFFLAKKERLKQPILCSVVYLFHPIALYVSGYHGQRDSVWIFFLLFALISHRADKGWLAGILIGLGASIKVPILFFAPLLFFYAKGIKGKYALTVGVFLTFFVMNLPEILLYPSRVIEIVFFYDGWTGWWGISGLINTLLNYSGHVEMLNVAGLIHRVVFFGLIILFSFLLALKRVNIMFAALIIALSIFVFGTSFAAQYLIWPLPLLTLFYSKFAWHYFAYLLTGTYLAANFYSIFVIRNSSSILKNPQWIS